MPAKRALLLALFLLLFLLPLTIFASKRPFKNTSRGATEAPRPNKQEGNSNEPQYVKNEIIVKFRTSKGILGTNEIKTYSQLDKGSLPASLVELNQFQEIKSIEKVFKTAAPMPDLGQKAPPSENVNPEANKVFKITFAKEIEPATVIRELMRNSEVEYAEPNYIFRISFTPNDPLYNEQWNLKKLELDKAWDLGPGAEAILAAVIDSGVDYRHPDFGACTLEQVSSNRCQKIAPGRNFIASNNDPKDDNGHGTHVAGIINALVNNSLGIASFDKNSLIRVIPLKAFDEQGSAAGDDVIAAIDYALSAQAKVVNMSFGSPNKSLALERLIQAGLDQKVVFVAAAGNESANVSQFYPAAYEGVMAVGATDENDHYATFSNYGSKVDFSAPGTEILSLYPIDLSPINNPYLRMSGTSMATPHVTALAALILNKNPNLTQQEVNNIISNSTDDLGTPGFDHYFGSGRINAFKALSQMNASPPTPLAKINYPTENLLLGRKSSIYGQAEGNNFESYSLSYSASLQCDQGSEEFQNTGVTISNPHQAVPNNGLLAEILLSEKAPNGKYCLKLTVRADGKESITINHFFLDKMIASGWPVSLGPKVSSNIWKRHLAVGDVNNDNQKEIVLTNHQEARLYAFDKEGSPLTGFPAYTEVQPDNTPTLMSGKIFLSLYRATFMNSYGTIRAWEGATGQPSPVWDETGWEDYSLAPSADAVVLEDINNDTKKEIIYRDRFSTSGHPAQKIYAFDQERNLLPGWENGVLVPNTAGGTDLADFSPLIGNLLGDPTSKNELVVNHNNWSDPEEQYASKFISVYDAGGMPIAEFSISLGREDIFNAALGDIDHDGLDEIVIVSNLQIGNANYRQPKVSVWKGTGEKLWQYALPEEIDTASTLALADFNNDSFPEIFTCSYYRGIAVILDKNGQPLRGFPDKTESQFLAGSEFASIAKLKNGNLLIVQNIVSPRISGIRAVEYNPNNGQSRKIENLDKNFNTTSDPLFYQPVAADLPISTDLDNDGKLEIIVSVTKPYYENLTYVFETGLEIAPDGIEWSQYRNDEGHTGAYHPAQAPPQKCRTCENFIGCLIGKTCMQICQINPDQCESKPCEAGAACTCRSGAPEEYRCPP